MARGRKRALIAARIESIQRPKDKTTWEPSQLPTVEEQPAAVHMNERLQQLRGGHGERPPIIDASPNLRTTRTTGPAWLTSSRC